MNCLKRLIRAIIAPFVVTIILLMLIGPISIMAIGYVYDRDDVVIDMKEIVSELWSSAYSFVVGVFK